MTDNSMLPVDLITVAFLCGPPFALGSFIFLRRRWPRSLTPIALCCALVIGGTYGLSFAASYTRISFWSDFPYDAGISVAYLAYCFLAASCLRIPFEAVRLAALLVTAVPICFGYRGGPLLFLSLGETTEPPKQMTSDLVCSVTMWGLGGEDFGYTVLLYKTWSWAPFLRREVHRASVDQSIDQPDVSCSYVFASYIKEAGTPLR